LRCEFDVPRFTDIRNLDDANTAEENFAWFQMPHDFEVPSSQKVEKELRHRILSMESLAKTRRSEKIKVKKPHFEFIKIKKPTQFDSVKSASSARTSNLSRDHSGSNLVLKFNLKKDLSSTSVGRPLF
jgi:hypothetical protein